VIVGVLGKQCGDENVFFKTKFLTILFVKWLIQEIFIYYEIKICDNGYIEKNFNVCV
jgi:hypothetical protein